MSARATKIIDHAKTRTRFKVSRDDIISANPIVDFVRGRGHELKPSGDNLVTSGCPTQARAQAGDAVPENAIVVVS